MIRVEVEKPRIEEISAGEERIEEIEERAKSVQKIQPKKPRFEEIYNEVVGEVEEKLQRPMNAIISLLRILDGLESLSQTCNPAFMMGPGKRRPALWGRLGIPECRGLGCLGPRLKPRL